MSKINLVSTLVSENENLKIETTGTKTNNKIVYKENNITVTILILNNRIEMNRLCDEYKINLIFEKNKKSISTYSVFGAPKIFELDTFTNKLIQNDKYIKINYELEGNNFSYHLKLGGKV